MAHQPSKQLSITGEDDLPSPRINPEDGESQTADVAVFALMQRRRQQVAFILMGRYREARDAEDQETPDWLACELEVEGWLSGLRDAEIPAFFAQATAAEVQKVEKQGVLAVALNLKRGQLRRAHDSVLAAGETSGAVPSGAQNRSAGNDLRVQTQAPALEAVLSLRSASNVQSAATGLFQSNTLLANLADALQVICWSTAPRIAHPTFLSTR